MRMILAAKPISFSFFVVVFGLFLKFLCCVGVQLIYNAVLGLGVRQSDPVIHMYVSIFQILFPFRSIQNIEQNYLCCMVGHCWLSI